MHRNRARKNRIARRSSAALVADYTLTGFPGHDTSRGWDRRILAAKILTGRGLPCADAPALRIVASQVRT